MPSHQLLQECETVHLGHFDVKSKHIGIQRLDFFARDIRIRSRSDDLNLRIFRKQHGQHLPHQRRVIDRQDSNLFHRFLASRKVNPL